MNPDYLFTELWKQYSSKTPSAEKIKTLFENEGNKVINDHIAIRTFNDPRVAIEVLEKPFKALGYEEKGEYTFKEKKLFAKHYENPAKPDAPKIFISQLLLEEFPDKIRTTIQNILDDADQSVFKEEDLLLKGRVWSTPSYQTYLELQKASEYAAWMYVNGFCSNHFTVDVNKLNTFRSLEEVNTFLKAKGFKLNTSGGEIKGSEEQKLEQSSTLADKVDFEFKEGYHQITSCYYEFAYRYKKENGKLFTGFIAGSADKIFESTDMKLQ